MPNRLTRQDVSDLDFADLAELSAIGEDSYLTASLVSTTSSTKTVVFVAGTYLIHGDYPAEVGDKLVISGCDAAGIYTIASIVNDTTLTVSEAIPNSSGGEGEFRYLPGATKIGVDTSSFKWSSRQTAQDVLKDLDTAIEYSGGVSNYDFLLDCEPNSVDNSYSLTRVGGKVTQESWTNIATSKLIKTIDYYRTNGRVSSEVRKIYDPTGTIVVAQLTVTYTRLCTRVISATYSRDI